MKTRIEPATMPGCESGTITRKTVVSGRAPEIGGGFDERRVEAFQRGVDGQHHEGQVAIDQAEQHRAVVIEQRQRRVDDAERLRARC